MQLGNHHFKSHGKAALATLLVALVLLLDAMAACPELHELIHQDAGKADHDCAVTMFAHGQMDSSVVVVAVVVPIAHVESLPQTLVSVFNPLMATLPLGRGPPTSHIPS